MDMHLCFGTFMKILDLCKYNTTQEKLIAEIVRIIDPNSRYINDRMASNKLKNCQINFVFYHGNFQNIPSLDTVKKSIKNEVIPFIDEDKKATVILSLLYIIQNEAKNKNEKKESFKKYFSTDPKQLLTQKNFVFSEFLSKVLLYTLYSGIDNRIGKDCANFITDDFFNEKISPYKDDCQWHSSTETLALLFREEFTIFNEAFDNYAVREFVEKTDPTNQINDKYIENCNNFLGIICESVWIPFGKNSIGKMLQMIQDFSQILNDYITYLGTHMIPLPKNPSVFVPFHRDEHPQWAIDFDKTIHNYRQQLVNTYNNICNYMRFEPILSI